MATADDPRPARGSRRPWLIPVAFVVVLATALVAGLTLGDDEAVAPGASDLAPVAVDATSIHQFATLEEMVAASDAIVVATVVATEQGRLVGDPQNAGVINGGVISRIVTIRIDEVLVARDDNPVGATVIVEEEGFLADGTPIIVNGVSPSEEGDSGVWFLDSLDDAEIPAYLVINSQGRYLVDGASLRGGDQRDPLVQALQQLTVVDLVADVRATIAAQPG